MGCRCHSGGGTWGAGATLEVGHGAGAILDGVRYRFRSIYSCRCCLYHHVHL